MNCSRCSISGSNSVSNRLVRAAKPELRGQLTGFARRQFGELVDGEALHPNVSGHRVQARTLTARARARFVFLDPFELALRGQLVFQSRFSVILRAGLQRPIPDFAKSAAFLASTMRRVE